MSDQDITLLKGGGHFRRWRLYYYQGNFYYPFSSNQPGVFKSLVREFLKSNWALVDSDRAHRNYKTITQIIGQQWPDTKAG